MPIFEHPVDPTRAYMWTRNGSKKLKGISVDFNDPAGLALIQGRSKTREVLLSQGGFAIPLEDLESFCRAFLAQREQETLAEHTIQLPEIDITTFADTGQNFLSGKLGAT